MKLKASRKRIWFASALALVLASTFLPTRSTRAQLTTTVVMSGLRNPRGIAFAPNGALYVAESGCGGNTSDCQVPPDPQDPAAPCVTVPGARACLGLTGAISRLENGTQTRVVTDLPSYSNVGPGGNGNNAIGPSDVSPVQTGAVYQLYATIGLQTNPANRAVAEIGAYFAQLIHIPPSTFFPLASGPSSFTPDWLISDIGTYEALQNPDTGNVDTNPYGLLAQRGSLLVTDAGGNALLRVDSSGAVSTVAVFPSRAQGRTFNSVLIDAVPTSVIVGPDGAYYVGELTGVQFFDGAANIYRVVPIGAPITNPEIYLSGFKSVIDIAFGPDGNLYVLQFATGATGNPANTGVLKRVELANCTTAPNDCPRTDIISGLNRPTSVAIGPDGALYVTNNGTSPTNGQVLRIEP